MAVPWCDPCDRFWNPGSITSHGTCPTCGQTVETPPAQSPDTDIDIRQKVPWHFWLAITAAGIYLTWRAIQGIALLF